MNSKVFFCLFILALSAIGCVSEFKADLPYNDEQILIVDGNIMENTEAVFYLSKSFPLDSFFNPQQAFNIDARITIIGSDGYRSLPAIYRGGGKYSIFTEELNDNVNYGIEIEYDGDTYRSALSKPLHTPEIDSISWIQPKREGPVFFRVSTHDNTTEDAKFFFWDYAENWEITPEYYTTYFLNPSTNQFYTLPSAPYYYCWKSNVSDRFLIGSTEALKENRIINHQLYQADHSGYRFTVLYCVTVNQKAISKGAYDYYQNKIQLNEETGGLFSPLPSELNGNITCITDPSKRVMGYVEVTKNVTQKRLFVYPNELSHPIGHSNCNIITNDSVLIILSESKGTYADIYWMGYRPITYLNPYDLETPSEWTIAPCTDCLAKGGAKLKPDFWPNDHE